MLMIFIEQSIKLGHYQGVKGPSLESTRGNSSRTLKNNTSLQTGYLATLQGEEAVK